VSIKLFWKWFVQFTIIWFHSSLKQNSSTGTEFISCFTVEPTFLLFLPELGQKCDQSIIKIVIIIFSLNEWWFTVIEYIIYYFYKHSIPFQVLNQQLCVLKEIQLWRRRLCFGVHDITTSFREVAADWESFSRQFKTSIYTFGGEGRVEEDDRTALLQLPKCVEKQPGTGHQRQICLSFENREPLPTFLTWKRGRTWIPLS